MAILRKRTYILTMLINHLLARPGMILQGSDIPGFYGQPKIDGCGSVNVQLLTSFTRDHQGFFVHRYTWSSASFRFVEGVARVWGCHVRPNGKPCQRAKGKLNQSFDCKVSHVFCLSCHFRTGVSNLYYIYMIYNYCSDSLTNGRMGTHTPQPSWFLRPGTLKLPSCFDQKIIKASKNN